MYEMVSHGRGGQGPKTAGLLLANAALKAGYYPKAFPEYGPERTGAPTRGFLRIDTRKVRTVEEIYNPDLIAIYDTSLLNKMENGKPEILVGLREDGILIVNTAKEPEEVWQDLREYLEDFKGSIYTINGSKIVKEKLGKNILSTAMFGAVAKALESEGIISMDLNMLEEVIEKSINKKTEENLEIVRFAYSNIRGMTIR